MLKANGEFMGYCTSFCNDVMKILQPLSSKMELVLAHESSIKDVPVSKIIAAVGVKKCTVSERISSVNDNVKVDTENRNLAVTVGINLYVPYSQGTAGCVSAFDDIFDCLFEEKDSLLCESKLLSTSYSRDTQCLVAKTEFVFETTIGIYRSEVVVPNPIG